MQMTNMPSKAKEQDSYEPLGKLLILALAGWVLYALVASRFADSGASGAQFGDMLGGFNALVTAFAFAALVFTVHLQRKELELQRRELRMTRREFRGQKEALQKQHAVAEIQVFENTLFQLLRLHHDIVGAMREIAYNGTEMKGRDAFESLFGAVREKFFERAPNALSAAEDLATIRLVYKTAYDTRQRTFGHYFRNLYQIVKFVHLARVADKSRYMAFVRAQLSTTELACLFYNCLSSEGHEKFKPLVEQYALFKNLPVNVLMRDYHAQHFAASAFAGSSADAL